MRNICGVKWFCYLALGVAGCSFGLLDGVPAFGQPGGGPTSVAVATVISQDAPPTIRLVGNVLPDRMATVAAEVAGIVAEFAPREGQRLSAGDPICRIDIQPVELRAAEGRAFLGQLEARLTELRNGTRKETLTQLEAAVAENKAMLDKWKFEQQRIEALFAARQANPKEQHDTAMEYLAAERRYTQSMAEFDLAKNGPRAEEILAAEQAVAAQRVRVELLERDVDRAVVRAPFDGYIIAKRTEVGAWLSSGGPVADFVAIDPVRVRVDVPESAVAYCKPGAPSTVEVEALARTVSATLTRVVPQATAAARTFPVEIEIPNPTHELLPGMFVWAHVPSGPERPRLMVSKDAIVADGPSKRIFVIRPGEPNGPEMAMPLPVVTGLERGGLIDVQAAGLVAGDRVVTRANERLHGPTPVIAMPMNPGGAPAGEPSVANTKQ